MPRTLVVWSARPIQPLMRVLVRPVGQSPGQHGRQVAGAEADQRIVGVEAWSRPLRPPRPRAPGRRCRGARSRRSRPRRAPGPRAPRSRRRSGRGRPWRSSGSRSTPRSANQSRRLGGKASPADQRLASARRASMPISAAFSSRILQEARRADVARRAAGRRSPRTCCSVWPVPPGNTVQPSACAPLSMIKPAGRHVVAEAVVHQVAARESPRRNSARAARQ